MMLIEKKDNKFLILACLRHKYKNRDRNLNTNNYSETRYINNKKTHCLEYLKKNSKIDKIYTSNLFRFKAM